MEGDAIILAIPSGGIPVAAAIASDLGIAMDLIIVRKLQIPFNPEAGFGAVTMDGEMFLNRQLLASLGLSSDDIEEAKNKAMRRAFPSRALLGDRRREPLNGGRSPGRGLASIYHAGSHLG